MSLQSWLARLGNPIFTALLRSPLHGIVDSGMMLISVTGRRSGRTYTTPVNYLLDGDQLTIVSLRERTWWRNLRDGAEVGLHLRGTPRRGRASVTEDEASVAAALAGYLRRVPAYARFLGVRPATNGEPEAEGLVSAARTRVIVNVQLI
jgi:deazaflavin-dependent oxidoreductase (nitroreductase family)